MKSKIKAVFLMAAVASTSVVLAQVTVMCGKVLESLDYDNGDPPSELICSFVYNNYDIVGCQGDCDWDEVIGRTECKDGPNDPFSCVLCQEDAGTNVPWLRNFTCTPCTPTDPEAVGNDIYFAGCGCYFNLDDTDEIYTDAPERYQGYACESCGPGGS